MVQLSFTAKTREVLVQERYAHPHPKVPRKLEAVYLTSLDWPHHLIRRICHLSEPVLPRYLRACEQGGRGRPHPVGLHGAAHQSGTPPGEFGGAVPPATTADLRARAATDRSPARRAAQFDPSADLPASRPAAVSQNGLCAGSSRHPGKTGRASGVAKKTSIPNWQKRQRASGRCCS